MSIRRFILGLGLFALPIFLSAQFLMVSERGLPVVERSTPDSIVQLTAEAYSLPQISREDLPRTGTYWEALPSGQMVPLPCPPVDETLPVYRMANGSFLVDATGGQVSVKTSSLTSATLSAAVETQGNAVADLIEQMQAAQDLQEAAQMFGLDLPLPGGGGGGSYTNTYVSTFVIDTNRLWLELTNVANGVVYGHLRHATNQVYALWATEDLVLPWSVVDVLWPGDTNSEPFTVATQNREMLFLRAEDWSGKDSNLDGVPDWWVWKYFGDASLAMTNLDYSGSGLTFAEDFTNNLTPTVFSFTSIAVTNNYVTSSTANVQLAVAGSPYYLAVLVDEEDFSQASWSVYSGSTVTVNLGLTQGWHNVWIGLRGHGDEPAKAVWQHKLLKLDWTPPVLFITSPISTTVNVPLIQMQGFSPEALSSISYDLTNAAGLLTNQQILVLNQYYDPNTWEFTTNTFQAFDVVLTNGVNTFVFQATDLGGNLTTASLEVMLDFASKTNLPNVQLIWPTNGTEVSGDNFTLDGLVDDATIRVSATITATNGSSSTVNGLVERDGKFWVENLPLGGGTNAVTLTATDVVGNTTTNHFSVVQSAVVLTVNPVSDPQQLWQATVNLTGNISNPSYAVWANGVKGQNHGNGTWSASNVPVNDGGTASFTVAGYAPNEPQPDGSYGNP